MNDGFGLLVPAQIGDAHGDDMKDCLSLGTFAIGVLCFIAFVAILKPNSFGAAQATNKLEHCQREASDTRNCGFHIFAAVPGAVFRPRW